MQSKAFSKLLIDIVDLLSYDATEEQCKSFRMLANVFTSANTSRVAKTLEYLDMIEVRESSASSTKLSSLAATLERLVRFAKLHMKPAAHDNLVRLYNFTTKNSHLDIEDLEKKAIEAFTRKSNSSKTLKQSSPEIDQAVERHLHQLNTTFGFEPEFDEAFAALKADPMIKARELKKIAKRFTKIPAKSGRDALRQIYSKHYVIIAADRDKKAIGSRVAG